ncbi:hypothetical protein COOONC_08611 [Cooperia oncophora]
MGILRRSCSLLMQYVARPSCSRFPASVTRPVSAVRVRQLHGSSSLRSVEKTRREQEFERGLINSRKQQRKRRPLTSQMREQEVVALALSESLDLQGISTDTSITNMYETSYIDDDSEDTIHLVKKLEYTINPTQINEIFVFQDGVAVFWNVSHAERAHAIRDLERYMEGPYESSVTMEEQDTMPFSVVEGDQTVIKHDRFLLSAEKHGTDHRKFENVLERFSLSQAFAASVKVGVWETLLNDLAEPLSNTTKALKLGIIPWTRKEALMKSGEFAALRHSINLDCTLLNRDFYWDRSQASTLEWMIIVLIVIEVIFDLLHFADSSPTKYRSSKPAQQNNKSDHSSVIETQSYRKFH